MKKVLLVAMFLLSGAVAASCQDLVDQDRYVDAGDCYKEAEQWNDCLYNYLRAAREAEKEYLPVNEQGKRYIGDSSDRTIALYYYNPDTAKVNKCLANSDHYGLRPKLEQYYNWIVYYPTNPTEPPFDIETEVIEVVEGQPASPAPEENVASPENETRGCHCPEYWNPVCGADGETYSNECFAECENVEIAYTGQCKTENKTENKTGTEEPKDASILFIGVIGAIVIIGLAALLLSRKKKDTFVCSECGKEFDSEKGLKIHVGKTHGKD